MTCKDCIHYEVCVAKNVLGANWLIGKELKENIEKQGCDNFKDKNKMISLPCKIGTEVYFIYRRINSIEYSMSGIGSATVQDEYLIQKKNVTGVILFENGSFKLISEDGFSYYEGLLGRDVFLELEAAQIRLRLIESFSVRIKERENND